MPDEITIDGMEEHAFRRSIETLLRHGRANEAADRLKALLPTYAGDGKTLPARMLEVTADQIHFSGWDQLAAKLNEYGRVETPITAVGIGIGDPEDAGLFPDDDGNLNPPLETSYFSDATYPFSETDRDDLLEGYSSYGCEWQGDFDKADHTLRIEGIDDLYGAIAALENKVGASADPAAEEICAGAVGACYLGVLVYQAARDAAVKQGLPRPLVILLVNSDAYPFFDAPVLTCEEYLGNGEVKPVAAPRAMATAGDFDDFDADESEGAASLISMVSTSRQPGKKKMALVLEGEEAANPLGMADDLIAQAAFEPESVDSSRYMPHQPVGQVASGLDNGDLPPIGQEHNSDAEGEEPVSGFSLENFDFEKEFGLDREEEESLEESGFKEIEFPVESYLPQGNDGGPAIEESDHNELPATRPSPPTQDAGFGGAEPQRAHAPDRSPAADQHPAVPDRNFADSVSDYSDDEAFQPVASFAESPGQDSPDLPDPDYRYSGPDAESADMQWQDQESDQSFALPDPPPARTSHSIRERIRQAQPVEEGPSDLVKFVTAIIRIIKRVHELLTRR